MTDHMTQRETLERQWALSEDHEFQEAMRLARLSVPSGWYDTESQARGVAEAAAFETLKFKRALEAVLLFYSPEWRGEEQRRWVGLTSTKEATTRGLCDFIRKTLGKAP